MACDVVQRARFYRALGAPIRLRIIEHLLAAEGCLCICELASQLKRDQSVVFRHIEVLREAGIVKTTKEERFLWCCIRDKKKMKTSLEE